MAYARGPYAEQATLPAPRRTVLAGSPSMNFATGRYEYDDDGNPRAMSETAQRVQLLVAFAIHEPSGFIDERSLNRLKQRAQEAVASLVKEGVIRDVSVRVNEAGVARGRVAVRYYDVLRSVPVTVESGGVSWVSASWEAGTPGSDGTLALAPWLTYECATAETSAQTSLSTVRTRFAAHAPRAVSRDGSTWGLLVEPAATNLITEQDLAAWGGSVSSISSDVAPDGSVGDVIATDGNNTLQSLTYAAGAFSGVATIGAFVRRRDDGAGTPRVFTRDGTGSAITIFGESAAEAWAKMSATADHTGANIIVTLRPRGSGAADQGSAGFWAMQFEAGAYPTSFIGADNATFTRAAGSLMALSSRIAPHGYFDVAITYAPQYAHDEVTGEHDLLYVDADNRCYYDGADDSFHLVLDGVEVATVGAVTFSALQELTVTIQHLDSGATLSVEGATTGDGADTAAPAARLSPAKFIHLLGNADGAQEGAELYAIASTAH
jgi:hypothetical protein